MENSRLHNLVQGFLDNRLSPREQQEFYDLLTDTGSREALAAAFMDITGEPDMHTEADPTLLPLLDAIRQTDVPPAAKVRRMPLRKWGWAAAVLVLLGAGGAYFLLRDQPASPAIVKQSTTPGRNGATLTLADGSTVALDSLGNGLIAQQAGTKVLQQNGQLVYDDAAGAEGLKAALNTITTPRGRQFSVVLPDGSKVWLNAASSVRYPVAFTGSSREVEITGEAYFEVAPDSDKPFFVHFNERTGKRRGTIEVLGTAFNVNAYTDEPVIKTTLLRGSVRVNEQILKPGEQARINEQDVLTVVKDVPAKDEIAWKDGLFIMNGTDLQALFRQVSRWYDVEVVVEGPLPHRVLGGTISRDVSLASIMEALAQYGLQCRLENGKLFIQS